MSELQDSYEFCTKVCTASHSNFVAVFRCLPVSERRAMEVVYAFMRTADDIVDAPGAPDEKYLKFQQFCTEFKNRISFSVKNKKSVAGTSLIFPAVADVIQRYTIPVKYFLEVLDGMRMDFERHFYLTSDELETYCYHVASAVGLICLHLWGVMPEVLVPGRDGKNSSIFQAAVACGKALQFTNILRDVREDALGGRVYLSLEDCCRCLNLKPNFPAENPAGSEIPFTSENWSEIQNKTWTDSDAEVNFRKIQNLILNGASVEFLPVLQLYMERTRRFYAEAAPLLKHIPARNRRIFRLIVGVYRAIFVKIQKNPLKIFEGRIRLNKLEKIKIYFQTFFPF